MTVDSRQHATQLLDRKDETGDQTELFQLVYGELRRVAAAMLRDERDAHTLQPTALVHEAWMRLIDCAHLRCVEIEEAKRSFFKLGARAMRQVLVDHARRHQAQKRGGGRQRITLVDAFAELDDPTDMIDLEAALAGLETQFPRIGRVAELRLFGGLPFKDIAQALAVSLTTVEDDWAMARAMLSQRLTAEGA